MNHDIYLRAPSFLGGGGAPVVVRRTDQRFIKGILADLATEEGRKKLLAQVVEQNAETDPILYLPTQRAFHVVLAEAYCKVPGEPRLAREKIKTAGAVIRRRLPIKKVEVQKGFFDENPFEKGFKLVKKKTGNKGSKAVYGEPQRWVSQADKLLGWDALDGPEINEDPDSTRRPAPRAGHAEIDRRLRLQRQARRTEDTSPYDETVTTLFVAPPEVCKAAGSTILYGIVQPVEPETAEKVKMSPQGGEADPPAQEGYTESEIRAFLPIWLRFRESGVPPTIPGELAGWTFRAFDLTKKDDDFPQLELQRFDGTNWNKFDAGRLWKASPGGTGTDLTAFVRFLWQVRVEFDVWGASSKSVALKKALDTIKVNVGGVDRKLTDWLFDATEVFVMMEEDKLVTFPTTWPIVPQTTHTAVIAGVKASMERRVQQFTRYEPRYGRDEARYQVRAFARVLHDPQCPPALVWSDPTKNYRVAKWYEGGPADAPLPTIELPTLSRGFLKTLQPNIAIKVPKSMFNFTNNLDMNDILDGKQKNDTSGPDLAWICGFNISIIFMIAFMLLISFVFMLNIVFWWVIFFRICIPLPGVSAPQEA